MNERLAGKTAFVTAAAQGIGRATAEAMARAGARVIATDIDAERLSALASIPDIATRRLDVRDAGAAAAAAAEAGAVDVLFNGAGFVHAGSVLDSRDEDWDDAFDLNVRSMVRTVRAFLPGMLERGRGSIVNVASVAGMKGVANRAVYATTKAAVVALTKSIAADYVARGIRCNAICPGTVDSPSLRDRIAGAGGGERADDGRRWRRRSSRASRWAGSAARRRSRCWRCTWRATNLLSPPAPRRSSTAAGRTDKKGDS